MASRRPTHEQAGSELDGRRPASKKKTTIVHIENLATDPLKKAKEIQHTDQDQWQNLKKILRGPKGLKKLR